MGILVGYYLCANRSVGSHIPLSSRRSGHLPQEYVWQHAYRVSFCYNLLIATWKITSADATQAIIDALELAKTFVAIERVHSGVIEFVISSVLLLRANTRPQAVILRARPSDFVEIRQRYSSVFAHDSFFILVVP